MDPSAVAATAGTYSTFAGVLAGLAFTGLCVYLSRRPYVNPLPVNRKRRGRSTPAVPQVDDVAAAIFYAMVSLAVSSFLYANLDGEATNSAAAQAAVVAARSAVSAGQRGNAEHHAAMLVQAVNSSDDLITMLLPYGMVLALSVLSLFYAVALMALQNKLNRLAMHTYIAVTLGGTVIVVRFLAGSAQDAIVALQCKHMCGASSILSLRGIWLTLVLTVALSLLATGILLQYGSPKSPDNRQGGSLGKLLDKLQKRRTIAPVVVFSASIIVATTASLYLNTQAGTYEAHASFIYSMYATSLLLVILFALACGRVIAPAAFEDRSSSKSFLCKFVPVFFVVAIGVAAYIFWTGVQAGKGSLSPEFYVLIPALLVLVFVCVVWKAARKQARKVQGVVKRFRSTRGMITIYNNRIQVPEAIVTFFESGSCLPEPRDKARHRTILYSEVAPPLERGRTAFLEREYLIVHTRAEQEIEIKLRKKTLASVERIISERITVPTPTSP